MRIAKDAETGPEEEVDRWRTIQAADGGVHGVELLCRRISAAGSPRRVVGAGCVPRSRSRAGHGRAAAIGAAYFRRPRLACPDHHHHHHASPAGPTGSCGSLPPPCALQETRPATPHCPPIAIPNDKWRLASCSHRGLIWNPLHAARQGLARGLLRGHAKLGPRFVPRRALLHPDFVIELACLYSSSLAGTPGISE